MQKKLIILSLIGFIVVSGNLFAQQHTDCDRLFLQAVQADDNNKVREHLDHFWGNLNVQDTVGRTGLMIAIEKGNRQMVEFILNANKSVINTDVEDQRGMTALMYAVDKGNPIIMQILLEEKYGVNVNFQTKGQRNTALHYAVEKKRTDMVLELLRNKSTQTTLTDSRGETAFMIAVRTGQRNMIRLFGNSPGFDVTARPEGMAIAEGIPPLLQAMQENYPPNVIQDILAFRGAVNSEDTYGNGVYEYLEASKYSARNKQIIRGYIEDADKRDGALRNTNY